MTAPRKPGRPRTKRRAPGEGSAYWNETRQRWEGSISSGSGKNRKRIVRTGATQKEVTDKLRALAERARTNDLSGPATVGDLATTWCAAHPQRAAQTHKRIGLHVIADDNIAPIRLHDLTTSIVERWLLEKRGGYSHRYLTLMRNDLGTMVTWAVNRRWMDRNPVKGSQVPGVENTEPKRTLNQDQAASLFEACRTSGLANARFMLVMLGTGCRPGEVAGLPIGNVDFDAKVIHVRQAITRGEGGRPLDIGDTKGKRTRSFEVDDDVLDAIRAELEHQEVCRKAAGHRWSWRWDGLVFLTANGTPPWASNLRKSLRLLAAEAGIFDGLTPYELRHTVASLMCDDGQPIPDIIDQLGHADERMLWKHYRHRIDPIVRNAAVIRRLTRKP